MHKLKSILVVAMILISQPNLVYGQNCEAKRAQCEQLLRDHQEVGKALLKETVNLQEQVFKQDQLIKDMTVELEEANQRSWYENPFLMFGLGLLTGVILENKL